MFIKKSELPYLPLQQLDHLVTTWSQPGAVQYAMQYLREKLLRDGKKLQSLGFHKKAVYIASPTPMQYGVEHTNPKTLGIYDKSEGTNNRALAYSHNALKGVAGGALVGAGLRAFTGKSSIGNVIDLKNDLKSGSIPHGFINRVKSRMENVVKPALEFAGDQRKLLTKNVATGLGIGGLAGLGLTVAHNALRYETTKAFTGKRQKANGDK